MCRRTWQPFFSPYDVCDFHQVIIHNIGQVVSRHAIAFEYYFIIQLIAAESDIASDAILYMYLHIMRYVQSDDNILIFF